MPVITLDQDRFSKLTGRKVEIYDMTKWLPWLGLDIEEVGPTYVKVEYNPNRMDFSSQGGIARAFCGIMEWETGLPTYEVHQGSIVLSVDSTVSKVRPYVLGAVIRDIKLDDEAVRELMEIQEDLHWGIGRDRRKASIGVHNLDSVEPPFTYKAVPPDEISFVPLAKIEEMTLGEILERHDKGVAYRHLVDWSPIYPIIVDRNGDVLSFPPVINGELTRVSSSTKNLFIDVTGPDFNSVSKSLKVLATALRDMGGTIETVRVRYPDKTFVRPDLSVEKVRLKVRYANKLLGLNLTEEEAIRCLMRCRLGAKSLEHDILEVWVPPYRTDILHEIDLVEEVAIGYGYYRLKPTLPKAVTTGKSHNASDVSGFVRQTMLGLGFSEVMNFILANEETQYDKMRLKAEKVIRLANPTSAEYSIARGSLLPSLMKNLSENKHESYPQTIFEVSDVLKIDDQAETRTRRELHAAAVASHPSANFTEVRSYAEALLHSLGIANFIVKVTSHPSFLEGRVASIQHNRKEIGIVGEIHPEVLNNFELENPTGAFEINLEELLDNLIMKDRKV